MSAPRVAVAGVVRRRQGIGEHLARFLVRHGAEVPAFLCSRRESVAEGRAVLASHGIDAAGHLSLTEALAHGRLDALVIASPAGTHAALLDAALEAGLHVLCEKPLVWDGPDVPGRSAAYVEAFAARGLLLFENTQWPFTLPAYRALHPGMGETPPRHFEMWLSPREGDAADMLKECVSHPLSLLQSLAPPPAGAGPLLAGLAFRAASAAADRIEVAFRHPGGDGIAVRVRLAQCREQPRPAGYAVDGRAAERRVRMSDYAQTFEHGGRSVDVPDPTDALVASFVAALGGAAPPDLPVHGPALSWRARAAWEIVAGFERCRDRGA